MLSIISKRKIDLNHIQVEYKGLIYEIQYIGYGKDFISIQFIQYLCNSNKLNDFSNKRKLEKYEVEYQQIECLLKEVV